MNRAMLIQQGNSYNMVVNKYCIEDEGALDNLTGDPPLSTAYLVHEDTGVVDRYIVSFAGNWVLTTGVLDLGIL